VRKKKSRTIFRCHRSEDRPCSHIAQLWHQVVWWKGWRASGSRCSSEAQQVCWSLSEEERSKLTIWDDFVASIDYSAAWTSKPRVEYQQPYCFCDCSIRMRWVQQDLDSILQWSSVKCYQNSHFGHFFSSIGMQSYKAQVLVCLGASRGLLYQLSWPLLRDLRIAPYLFCWIQHHLMIYRLHAIEVVRCSGLNVMTKVGISFRNLNNTLLIYNDKRTLPRRYLHV